MMSVACLKRVQEGYKPGGGWTNEQAKDWLLFSQETEDVRVNSHKEGLYDLYFFVRASTEPLCLEAVEAFRASWPSWSPLCAIFTVSPWVSAHSDCDSSPLTLVKQIDSSTAKFGETDVRCFQHLAIWLHPAIRCYPA